ncbi:MAG: large-conductance mechanosensitive channel protein MscL [Syntrophorhabdales bacterium]|jgi:large conductance mechanosensitive channel
MAFVKEFKEFIARGNMIDLAVAVVIGAAFGAIVTSLVKDIVMPPIGLALGRVDFSNLFLVLKEGSTPGPYPSVPEAAKAGAVTVNYGIFIMTLISFLIIAFVVFTLVRTLNRLRREKAVPEAPDTKECTYCYTRIPVKAVRCPNCTSELKQT